MCTWIISISSLSQDKWLGTHGQMSKTDYVVLDTWCRHILIPHILLYETIIYTFLIECIPAYTKKLVNHWCMSCQRIGFGTHLFIGQHMLTTSISILEKQYLIMTNDVFLNPQPPWGLITAKYCDPLKLRQDSDNNTQPRCRMVPSSFR
jgi:hypothetical protein